LNGKGISKSVVLGMLLVAVLTFLPVASASEIGKEVTKSDVKITLLENTDFCDTNCFSRYEVCYPGYENIDKELSFEFRDSVKYMDSEKYMKNVFYEDSKSRCKVVYVYGKKGMFENIDNVPVIKGIEFTEFAWWNTSYPYRSPISFINTIPTDGHFSVNDTHLIAGTPIWTKKVAETMYLYCQVQNCSTGAVVGNGTTQLVWENATSRTGNSPTSVYQASLNGLYHFEADFEDSTSNNIDFSNSGVTFSSGVFGNSAYFDSTDMLTRNSGADLSTSNLTWTTWVKTSDSAAGLITKWTSGATTSYILITIESGLPNFLVRAGSSDAVVTTGNATINDSQWHHIAGVRDASSQYLYLYVDGVQVDSATGADVGADVDNGDDIEIGRGTTYSSQFAGYVDEPQFYTRLLTSDEILYQYQNGINQLTSGINTTSVGTIWNFRAYDEETEESLTFNITINNGTASESFNSQTLFQGILDEIPNGEATITFNNESGGYVQRNRIITIQETGEETEDVNLFLLKTASASLINFIVINNLGSSIQDATVTAQKLINGSYQTVASGLTDASGNTPLILNALTSYRIIVSAEGYNSITFMLTPSNPPILITLSRTGIGTRSTPFSWITYSILPDRGLNAGTNETITYTVNSLKNDLDMFGMNITYNGSVIFNSTDSSLPGGGSIFGTANLENASNFDQLTVTIFFQRINDSVISVNRTYTIFENTYGNFTIVNIEALASVDLDIFQRSLLALLITGMIIVTVASLGFRSEWGLGALGWGILAIFTRLQWFSVETLIVIGLLVVGTYIWRR